MDGKFLRNYFTEKRLSKNELNYSTFQILFNSIETFREQGRATLVGSYFTLKERSISMITDTAKYSENDFLLNERNFEHIIGVIRLFVPA